MTRWLAGMRVALRSIFRRTRLERELREELQFHLDHQIAEELKAGLSPQAARDAALRSMGAIEKHKEECRDLRSGNLVADFAADVRYAARSLRRRPAFALFVVSLMALGIGANTAVFSVINGVLLKPLPYPNADRIVVLHTAFLQRGETQPLVSIANFRDWRDRSTSFEAMASYRPGETSVTTGATAEYGRVAGVDAQFFRVFGIEPTIGRVFTPEEMQPGTGVLISHELWQSRFGGDPRVVERTVRIGNESRPIIGVMPSGFHYPRRTDVWVAQATRSTSRTGHNFFAVGRLKAGISLHQAQSELNAIASALEQQYPESNKGRGVTAARLQDQLVGDVRLTLYLLWAVVGLVLLIACANTATLLLGKAASRSREVAVRVALGANRRRVIRQLITESLLLALIAGAFGLLLADWGTRALLTIAPADVVRDAQTRIDGGVLAFTVIVSAATSLLFGLVPALHASKVDLVEALKQGGTRAVLGGNSMRARGVLVTAEIALAVMLLAGAGVVIKSLVALQRVELGFQPQNVLVMKATGVRTLQETTAFFNQVLTRIAQIPGVTAVGATSIPPGDLTNAGTGLHFVDRMPAQPDRTIAPETLLTVASPGVFAALGIPLKAGRDFNDGDTNDAPLVAIVNEALVRKSFAGENPIGRTIFCPFDRPEGMTIIGVVGDVRQRDPAIAPSPECYMPYRQHNYNGGTLNVMIRTAGEPASVASAVRRAAAEVSPDVPVAFRTMEDLISDRVEDPRFRALLFGLFAMLALSLALAGVYGVMAFAVEQRSKEIGLRMALGASKSSVLQLIVRQGLVLLGVGLVVGLAGAAAASRFLKSLLYEVEPIDVPAYAAVVTLLAAGAVIAGSIPAWRAAIVDPGEVLKAE